MKLSFRPLSLVAQYAIHFASKVEQIVTIQTSHSQEFLFGGNYNFLGVTIISRHLCLNTQRQPLLAEHIFIRWQQSKVQTRSIARPLREHAYSAYRY